MTDLSVLTPDDLNVIREVTKAAWEFVPERLKKTAKDYAQSKWASVIWPQRAEFYFSTVYARVAVTRLFGHPKEIRLTEIFTDVYIYDSPLSTKRRSPVALDAQSLRAKRQSDEEKRVPVAEILKERRVFLTGKPGAGKTTLLRHLVLQSIKQNRNSTPIYVALKDVIESAKDGRDVDLWGHIVQQFSVAKLPDTSDFLTHLFDGGRAALMLDGLDEVTERSAIRSSLITQILRLTARFPKTRVIITCRVGADTYTFEKFAVAQIADFSPSQQVSFVSAGMPVTQRR